MCGTCGCSDDTIVSVTGRPADGGRDRHGHPGGHGRGQDGHRGHPGGTGRGEDGRRGRAGGHDHHGGHGGGSAVVTMEQDVLAKNDRLARRNRDWLTARGHRAVNLMSSPGSGKTTLLERTVATLSARGPVVVVEGDQATPLDAERIRAVGCPTVQVNTGSGCHLDADMLYRALRDLDPAPGATVLVENVGNLVCPALFDLGEHHRVVLASTTEGEDKPLKYPHMFRTADLVLLTKVDLLPHLDFDPGRFTGHLRRVNPRVELVPVSSVTADGLDRWYAWLRAALARATPDASPTGPTTVTEL